MTLYFLIISVITAPRIDVFPALLVPAISIVLDPSTRKLITPAPSGEIILFFISSAKVHGLSLCRLNAYANPVGFIGGEITATLDIAPGTASSVSRIGFASSNGLPDINLSFDAHDSPSVTVGTIF